MADYAPEVKRLLREAACYLVRQGRQVCPKSSKVIRPLAKGNSSNASRFISRSMEPEMTGYWRKFQKGASEKAASRRAKTEDGGGSGPADKREVGGSSPPSPTKNPGP